MNTENKNTSEMTPSLEYQIEDFKKGLFREIDSLVFELKEHGDASRLANVMEYVDEKLDSTIQQKQEEYLDKFVELLEKADIERVGGLFNGDAPVVLSSDKLLLKHLLSQIKDIAKQFKQQKERI